MSSPQPPIDLPECLRQTRDGLVLLVSAAPGAKRTEAMGLLNGALRVRLAAQPVEGQANAALLRWLADELDLPRSRVSLLRGDTSRSKQVLLDASLEAVLAWLQPMLRGR